MKHDREAPTALALPVSVATDERHARLAGYRPIRPGCGRDRGLEEDSSLVIGSSVPGVAETAANIMRSYILHF